MYLVGLAPLVLLIFLRRNLPETERFEKVEAEQEDMAGKMGLHLTPLLQLIRMYPGRLMAIGGVIFFFYFMQEPAYFLAPKYLQETHDWKPYYISAFAPLGALSIWMNMIGGWMGDRYGRRITTMVFLTLTSIAGLALFTGSGFLFLGLSMVAVSALAAASRTNLHVYSAELFPTSYRSTAGGALMVLNSLGGMIGLAVQSLLFRVIGSHPIPLALFSLALLPMLVCMAFLPETSRRSLEEIAPEREDKT